MILIAGPCVIENEDITLRIAEKIKNISFELGVDFYYKASFDKANRTCIDSFRGSGMKQGLKILQKEKHTFQLKIVTEIHEYYQA